ncbi:MAG: ATP-binding protein [Solirubrobacterales bacterium]|nr:ATP-binding protein [Solirubrobacterales bacterium]
MSLSGYSLGGGNASPPPEINESYSAVAESVPRARSALAQFAAATGANEEQVDGVRLAVSEAMTNAVQHAYGDRPGRVGLTAWLVGDELWVLITDEGAGLRGASNRGGLGLGLALIEQASDRLTIVERASGGTELRICFKIGSSRQRR